MCEAVNPTDPKWWFARHPQHKPRDYSNPADKSNPVGSFTIDFTTISRAANPDTDVHGVPIADLGYTNELTSGELQPWMPGFKSQRITYSVSGTEVSTTGTVKTGVKLTYQCNATNATSGTYSQGQQITAYPEPVPVGLAQFLYNSLVALQFEGDLTLQEAEVSGSLLIGQVFNLTGGALAEWSAMNAMVQSVTESIDQGQTHLQFGPPKHLSAGELVDLLRTMRGRLLLRGFGLRISGA